MAPYWAISKEPHCESSGSHCLNLGRTGKHVFDRFASLAARGAISAPRLLYSRKRSSRKHWKRPQHGGYVPGRVIRLLLLWVATLKLATGRFRQFSASRILSEIYLVLMLDTASLTPGAKSHHGAR